MRLSRILAAAVILLLVAAGAYTGYWFITANRLHAGLIAWADRRRAAGYDVRWDREEIAGFPTVFRIALTDASIARGASYRVSVPEVSGVASPLDLTRWHVAAPRGGTGTIEGIDSGIAAQSLSGEVVWGRDDTVFDVSALRLSGGGATAGELAAQVAVPRQAPKGHRDLGLDATVQLFHLTLPKPVRGLGDTIETFVARVKVMGGLPPGGWRQSLQTWRDDGGTVELTRGGLDWGALQLEADGTLALDTNLQPIAAMSASIVNYPALIDAAVDAGMLAQKNATLVKLVLELLAKRGADGRVRLTAPVTLQDRLLSIGRAQIGRVPAIEWR